MSAISTASLTRNVLWNFAGQVAPLFAAVFAIPLLIKGMGVDRFGLLTLAWMVIGYFSLFDFGLGRALIKLVSEKLGEGRSAEIPELVWTALFLMALLGLAGAGVMFVLTGWLVTSVLKIPAMLQVEASDTFRLLAWSVPVVILTTGFRGILEAYRRFDLVNIVRLPLGVLTFIAPLAVLPFSSSAGRCGGGVVGGPAADLRDPGGHVRTGHARAVAADLRIPVTSCDPCLDSAAG